MKLKNIILLSAVAAAGLLTVNACKTGIPKGAQVVKNFNVEKYLGKWYEIARLDFRFEKGLEQTTAQYSLNPDGSVKVVNRGLKTKTGEWKESIGEAKFIGDKSVGRLKVSFFKPIWASYNILSIDGDYQYALIAGDNLDYLWILSRDKDMPEDIKQKYLKIADELGYKTDKLVWPNQE